MLVFDSVKAALPEGAPYPAGLIEDGAQAASDAAPVADVEIEANDDNAVDAGADADAQEDK